MDNHQEFIFYACLYSLMGSIIGSFLNVVIYRLPIILERQWHPERYPNSATFNLVTPNSHCPHCKAPVKIWSNIPVLGWLLLRGKCLKCSTPIAWRYPIVELTGGLLAYLAFHYFGHSPQAIAATGLSLALLCLVGIDIQKQLLPDIITLPLLWAGLLFNAVYTGFASLESAVYGAAAGYLLLWITFQLFKRVTGKDGMGYGDFKLLAALGAWLGWQAIPEILIISAGCGALFGIAVQLVKRQKQSQPLPFGPWLSLAGILSLYFGSTIRHWYLFA